MATRTLDSPPSILPLYARAAAPMVPGASLLPFVPGRGKEIPEIELTLPSVRADAEQVAAYSRVCGFSLRDTLPPTYPHVLAFPLHMAVMADGSFPFGAVGLVHVENTISQLRPIGIGEELEIKVKPTKLKPHPKGRTFSLLTKVKSGNRIVWESTSTMLRRGGGEPSAAAEPGKSELNQPLHPADGQVDAVREGEAEEALANAEWRLGGDLGRRYAAVSGDRNPIHMHSLTAKPLGFPRAIAHGMWSKARCLAAMESRLPDAFEVGVRFRKPILLPGRVEFTSAASEGDAIQFAVRDAKRGTPHLDGRMEPLEAKPKNGRK
ncbi:MAG TPA: MaoC/PaaZ C-terminal domain-containing protein [Solirubrobacterales bacterium]|nr:MaoC/PaaZ C-terminal domain-containing protein [Solirubrobacterales bacterium]